jgi:ribonuclease BN (tRNA processing enzyme)
MLPEIGVILDAGTGMFRARDLIQTETLDIFLSHVHLDHCFGLTFLYDVLFEKELKRVTVHIAEDKIAALRDHLYAPLLFPVEPNFEIRPLPVGRPFNINGDLSLSAIPLEHPGGSHAFRLDWPDRSLAYVTDTVANSEAAYIQQIQNVKTLIHECYFPDGWEDKAELTGHSCLTPVAQVAQASNAGRLFLVHINPLDESDAPFDLDSVSSIFANVQVAEDHQVIDV